MTAIKMKEVIDANDVPAYWDRVNKTVRLWKNDEEVVDYRGPILMYTDAYGAALFFTMLVGKNRAFIYLQKC